MNPYDKLEIRCPRLGHELSFFYCRQEAGDLPCQRIIKCWESFFPVETCLKESLTPEEWDRFIGHVPKDKMVTLMDLIEQAKARVRKKD